MPTMTLNFYLRYHTIPGQIIYLSGSNAALGNNELSRAIALQWINDQFCHCQLEVPLADIAGIPLAYRYILKEADGNIIEEWKDEKTICFDGNHIAELILIDAWNHAGTIDNAFYTKPFKELLALSAPVAAIAGVTNYTHEFKVKCPLLNTGEILCLLGTGKALGDWNTATPLLMAKQDNWYSIKVNLNNSVFPISYKYGVYNSLQKCFIRYENGDNRSILGDGNKGKLTILHDGFVRLNSLNWRGAGVAIPVFSLRSENSFGTGEFTDLNLMVDWAKLTGLKLIQLLPINDTTATHTYQDSYPYAAVSAFGLHPLFLNLATVAGKENAAVLVPLLKQQKALNALPDVDYVAVMELKMIAVKKIYDLQKLAFNKDTTYLRFFEVNHQWLVPYAVFCYLRDANGTADYSLWPTHKVYNEAAVLKLASPAETTYDGIALHYFIQYHLHLQLKTATDYAHKNSVVLKGDLPIGIYRYSCDAWMAPELYNMDQQAGAPPDDFAVKGQNWGFPTYNWSKMKATDFAWWRQRFEQMSIYFDVFRIDHILGFFRIWSIPLDAVEGILGHFVPAIPISLTELNQQEIAFEYHRYCTPYITEKILKDIFGEQAGFVKENCLNNAVGTFQLKPEMNTQQKVQQYFARLPKSDAAKLIQKGLFDLISNIIFIEEPGAQLQQFHFRIDMEKTISFQELDDATQQKLKVLYIDYFFKRQDNFWRKEALNKLPDLRRSTDMLVCGEDLGMVPDCVPDVMEQLGLLSLEIQRMPKQLNAEFSNPKNAPYLSVVTPATHDMSTIRGWWQEKRNKTQSFYNNLMGQAGAAPANCEPWINREIVVQHLQSPAMWSVFQLQDLLGSSSELRRTNPNDERINIPANPHHYWKYRMHLTLETLLQSTEFNTVVKNDVVASGR